MDSYLGLGISSLKVNAVLVKQVFWAVFSYVFEDCISQIAFKWSNVKLEIVVLLVLLLQGKVSISVLAQRIKSIE